MEICHARWLGQVPYQPAWDLQNQLATQIARREIPQTLLLLEHPHTITFGRRGRASNLLWSEDELKQMHIQVFWVDRGGDVTYHGPGQLVVYPLIRLNNTFLANTATSANGKIPQVDYIAYLRQLEQVIILALTLYGIPAGRIEKLTGVWVNHSKIAAIGVKVDAHGITRHGFALNVSPDMNYWESIVGCGLAGYSITSMAELLPEPPPMDQVVQTIIASFEKVFSVECLIVS